MSDLLRLTATNTVWATFAQLPSEKWGFGELPGGAHADGLLAPRHN
jgi:hypothetical protein